MSARTCSRVALSTEDKRRLWSESGGYCQNPSCGRYLFAEGSDVDFAEMAHIIPASTGGPRDVPVEELPARERAQHDNIVVLCATCHTIVDKDPTSYNAGLMREWKQRHQDALERAFGTPTYASRPDARARIAPLLRANRLIHRRYGPMPGEFSDTTAAQWRRHVRATILPNNREILRVLDVNRHLLTPDELDTLDRFALHVRELEYRHLLNGLDSRVQPLPGRRQLDPEGRGVSGIRAWVVRKLREGGSNDRALELVRAHGLRVARSTRPDALIYCAGVGDRTFNVEDLDRPLEELPDVQFVVVVPTHIAPAVHIRAVELGLCVGGFAELGTALDEDDDVSRHQTREQTYVLRRLNAPRVVRSVRRTGLSSYEVERSNLPSLTIVTSEAYEITADEVYSLLEAYSGFDVDAIAVTNPNAKGVSSDARQAGKVAGVRVLPLNELLLRLGERWT